MYYSGNRRKRGKIWLVLLFFCAVAVGLGIGYAGAKIHTLPPKIEAVPKTAEESAPSAQANTPQPMPSDNGSAVSLTTTVPNDTPQLPAKEGYFVQTVDDKVYVFKINPDGSTVYSQTLPVELGDLPQSDKDKLSAGIYLENKTELAELMEDYSS